MLDVEKGWEAFNNFENYLFIPDCEDFFQFTGKWNVRHQAAVDAGISYPNSLLAFKLLRNSNLSASVQSQIISTLCAQFKDDCNIVHLITYLISKETQNTQNFKSVPKQVNSEQSLGCLPTEEKVDIPREIDPLYSDETIKLEYYNVEEEMVDNDKINLVDVSISSESSKNPSVKRIGNLDYLDENAAGYSSVFNLETSTPCIKRKIYNDHDRLINGIQRLETTLTIRYDQLEANIKDWFQYYHNKFSNVLQKTSGKLSAEISCMDTSNASSKAANIPKMKKVANLKELKELETSLHDEAFFSQYTQSVVKLITGQSVYVTAYTLLPKIMEKDFLVDVSLTPGFGENMTLKPVILDEFPKVLSLITNAITVKWGEKFEYNSEKELRDGLSRYLRNTGYENRRKRKKRRSSPSNTDDTSDSKKQMKHHGAGASGSFPDQLVGRTKAPDSGSQQAFGPSKDKPVRRTKTPEQPVDTLDDDPVSHILNAPEFLQKVKGKESTELRQRKTQHHISLKSSEEQFDPRIWVELKRSPLLTSTGILEF
ncbi:uncharacterized protein LOC111704775 isoform X2 [Eurytemora carolleeae]|uniref:uncharacterized protein LOC111704775 isoform X2 n=1 Tax=Eurytemora carolleeae TaxID=1294199 RepID=UPI000C779BDA|nr:uncharacterized protein LOC111704775 isoform X2 [Eurytemora carolleeae]|eukprot:XP_023332886.1 uncharacterized protein LOC111704775 isoform X2 [Eurytemora affinis]